jgi:hypothetical protein
MRADNSRHVIAAAHRRAAATRKRAVSALHRMDKAGRPITFDAVAREAAVSRSWLYNQPDLRAEVERLRARRNPSPPGRPRGAVAWLPPSTDYGSLSRSAPWMPARIRTISVRGAA